MTDTPLIDKTFDLILSPNKSGVYISKPDINKVAVAVGFSIILQERKRMMNELFKSIRTKEELSTLYGALIAFYDAKRIDYESVFGFFPSGKDALEGQYGKCVDSIQKLKELKEEAELMTLSLPQI